VTAGNAIELNTDTGSIVMTDSAGNLAGALNLTAPNVWAGDANLLSLLESNADFSGRDAALATNNGADNPLGYIEAGTISVGVSNTFFVQNSGTSTDFGGITPGDGGLTIGSTGVNPSEIDIYGRQLLSNGTQVTGDAFASNVPI